jgi:hypothetical protein
MIRNLNDPFATYTVPFQVDPGNFTLRQERDAIRIHGTGKLPLYRSGGSCDVVLQKVIQAMDSPFPSGELGPGVSYVGYTQATTLGAPGFQGVKSPYLDIWNIAVLPAAGWMIVPTRHRATPRDYLALTSSDRIVVGEDRIMFRIDGDDQHKIGVRAKDLTGRAGYLYEGQGGWRLLVREFRVDAAGLYVDTPWDNLHEYGYCFQSYNDSGESGQFGELEYHSTAIGGDSGRSNITDISHVWGYCGPEKQIRKIGESLLGVSVS